MASNEPEVVDIASEAEESQPEEPEAEMVIERGRAQKRRAFTIRQKLDILADLDGKYGGSSAKGTGVPRRSIQYWIKGKDKLVSAPTPSSRKRYTTGRRSNYPELDKRLLVWFQKRREDKLPVTLRDIYQAVAELRVDIPGMKPEFIGGRGYVLGWSKRNGIGRRATTHTAQQDNRPLAEVRGEAVDWLEELQGKTKGYDKTCIFNMDFNLHPALHRGPRHPRRRQAHQDAHRLQGNRQASQGPHHPQPHRRRRRPQGLHELRGDGDLGEGVLGHSPRGCGLRRGQQEEESAGVGRVRNAHSLRRRADAGQVQDRVHHRPQALHFLLPAPRRLREQVLQVPPPSAVGDVAGVVPRPTSLLAGNGGARAIRPWWTGWRRRLRSWRGV